MRQRADVDAARRGDLAHPQRQRVVAAPFGHAGQKRDLARARQVRRQAAVELVGAPGLADLLEPPDRRHHGQPRKGETLVWGGFGHRHRDGLAPQLRRRDLTVEGGAEGGGLRVGVAGVAGSAGLHRPRHPVPGARLRDRARGQRGDPFEMTEPVFRLVEEAQRVPAGVELRVGRHRRALGRMRGGDGVGEVGPVDVEHLARQHPPFHPPGIGVDDVLRVAPHRQHRLGRLHELAAAAQEAGLGEQVCRHALLRRHRVEQRAGVLVAAVHGVPGRGQRFGARQRRHAQGRLGPLGMQHGLQADAVVLAWQRLAEFGDQPRLRRGVKLRRAPDRSEHGRRARLRAQRPVRPRQQQLAVQRQRRPAGKGVDDGLRLRQPAHHGALAVARDRVVARPAVEVLQGRIDLAGGDGREAAARQRPCQDGAVERSLGEAVADRLRGGDVGGGKRGEPARERVGRHPDGRRLGQDRAGDVGRVGPRRREGHLGGRQPQRLRRPGGRHGRHHGREQNDPSHRRRSPQPVSILVYDALHPCRKG